MAGWGVRVAAVALLSTLIATASAVPAGAADRVKVRRPGPLRVLLVGDSFTARYQDAAAEALRSKGYQVFPGGVEGTGLLDANQCRGRYAYALLTLVDPDVVVFTSVGNYIILPHCSPTVAYASKQFFRKWKTAARITQRALTRKAARFLWVLAPAGRANTMVPRLNEIYRKIAGKRAGVIDAWTAFGGATYQPALHEADGNHLNAAGSQRLAALVVAAVG
jgi:lysophospholipase L1-like esterase